MSFCVTIKGVEKDITGLAKYLNTTESNIRTKFNYHRKNNGKTDEEILAYLVQDKKDEVRLVSSFNRRGTPETATPTIEPVVMPKKGRGRPKMKATLVRELMKTVSKRSITYNGVTKTGEEWQKESGVSDELIYDRITNRWEVAEAVSQPQAASMDVVPVVPLVPETKIFDTLKTDNHLVLAKEFIKKTMKNLMLYTCLAPEARKCYEHEIAQAIEAGTQIVAAL